MFWSWLHGELGSIILHITHILHIYISHNPSVAGCFSRQMLAARKYSKIHRQFRCKTHSKWCISRCQTKYCIHCCAYTSTKNMEVLKKQLAIVPGVLQFEISCWIPLMFQPIHLTVVEQRYTDLWKCFIEKSKPNATFEYRKHSLRWFSLRYFFRIDTKHIAYSK